MIDKMADLNRNHLMISGGGGDTEANLENKSSPSQQTLLHSGQGDCTYSEDKMDTDNTTQFTHIAENDVADDSTATAAAVDVAVAALEHTPGSTLSTCLVCGKQDRSVEFIFPDKYCSLSCADKHGEVLCTTSNSSSEFGDSSKSKKSKPSNKSANEHTGSHRAPGKRKKKKASYLSAYEENLRMSGLDDWKINKKKGKMFKYGPFFAEEGLEAAPEELFIREPPASFVNLFTLGMKLEAIDPLHPTAFCVVTVKEVKGHRVRLHFDGYMDCYDFWTNANSDEIFPAGWCAKNGKLLQPPKGMTKDSFNWEKYLQVSKSTAAPEEIFAVCTSEYQSLTPVFQVGDKLEAVDVKDHALVCVATVSDTYGDKLLIHFDGWEDTYDYWCYNNSLYIHHVGWCQENGRILSAPNGYPQPDRFTWDSYTEETKSRAAPPHAFKPATILQFDVGMVLESVDKRNPLLVRVAQVLQVVDNRILIHFSGWDNKYDYWEDADSPDLHPVGWCQRTGHPLQPPLTPLHIVNYNGCCPTPGCYGYGHVKGAKYSAHHSLFGCPYSDMNMNKDYKPIDRLQTNKTERKSNGSASVDSTYSPCATEGCDGTGHVTGKFPTHFTISGCPLAEVNQNKLIKTVSVDTSGAGIKRERGRTTSGQGRRNKRSRRHTTDVSVTTAEAPRKTSHFPLAGKGPTTANISAAVRPPKRSPSASQAMPPPPAKRTAHEVLQDAIYDAVYLPAVPVRNKTKDLPVSWERNIHLLPRCNNIPYSQVSSWTCQQVAEYIKSITPQLPDEAVRKFIDQGIDGAAYLQLQQKDITLRLGIKLGPAVIIYNSIRVINRVLGRPTS